MGGSNKLPIKPGDRFGHLTVIERAGSAKGSGAALYRCKCDCGRERVAAAADLKRGRTTQCETWDHEILGKRFGRLTVIDHIRTETQGTHYLCRCDCGNEAIVKRANLTEGRATSCGCYQREALNERFEKMQEQNVVDGTNLGLLNNRLPANNTSGVKGVCWNKRENKWMARIKFRGHLYHLGYYKRIEDAAEARREAEMALFDPVLEKHGRELTSDDERQRQLDEAVKRIQERQCKTPPETEDSRL